MSKDKQTRSGPNTRQKSRVPKLDFTTKFQVYRSQAELKVNE